MNTAKAKFCTEVKYFSGIKVILGMLLLSLAAASFFTAPHCSAKVYREKCGENVTWEYDTKTKILKISGTGAVTTTVVAGEREGCWGDGDDSLDVKKIIISEGITALDSPDGLFGYIHPITNKGKRAKLQLPDSLEYIGSLSFGSMPFYMWLTDITIPKNVKYIAPAAICFDDDDSLSLSVASDNPYFCVVDGVLFSKDKKSLICYPQSKTQKEYILPSSVEKIAPMAFQRESHLERVILPDGLKELGSGAFFECNNLEYVNLSDQMKIKSITDYDTSNLAGRKDWDCLHAEDPTDYYREPSAVSYNRTATETRAGTFEGTAIQSIHIPNSVKYLSSNTFFNDTWTSTFTDLREISFGKDFSGEINTGESQGGMKTLTLNGGYDLKISIPKSNKKYCIEDGILYSKDKSVLYYVPTGYKGKTLVLPETVKKIANGAFTYTFQGKIRHVIVPGDLESIGYNAFAGCSGIKTFTCNGKIDQMGEYAFADCYELKTVKIKELKEIPNSAFAGCSSLKTIDCGTKVEKIGSNAFYGCDNLTKLSVGNQIQSIAEYVFDDCSSLSPNNIPKTQQQQMEENLMAARQLIEMAYKTYLRN